MIEIKYRKETELLEIIVDSNHSSTSLFFKIGKYIGENNLQFSSLYANAVTILDFDIDNLSKFLEKISVTEIKLEII